MSAKKKPPKGKESDGDKKKVVEDNEIPNVPEILPDIRHIRIMLQSYLNITPTYSISELSVHAKHLDKDLGISSKTPVSHDNYIPTLHEFVLECDLNSPKDLDGLISNPIIMTVYENIAEMHHDLLTYYNLPPKSFATQDFQKLSLESALDLSEAFTGKTVDRDALNKDSEIADEKAQKKKKSDAGKKDARGQRDSTKLKSTTAVELPSVEPVLLGITVLDLIPLFQGQREINETLLVHQPERIYDDRIIPSNIMPRIVVSVVIDEDTWLSSEDEFNIFSFTVESIYNLPSLMSSEMLYRVCMPIPSESEKWEPYEIVGGKLKTKHDIENPKQWPGMAEGVATNYRIDDSLVTIKNTIDADLEVITSEELRMEWNVIKRNYMKRNATEAIRKRIKKYRRLPLELYLTRMQNPPPGEESNKGNEMRSRSKSETSKKSKPGGKSAKTEPDDYLHLMTAIDVSSLLYPGITSCRVVCALSSYHELEILQQTGQDDSYFIPKPPASVQLGNETKKKGGKGGDSGNTDSVKKKKGSAKESKSSKKSKNSQPNKNDLKPLLPAPPPPPPEPSTAVYNEKGQRTFIIIEIEFLKPLLPKREIEDLSNQLSILIPAKPIMPKLIVSSRLALLNFKDIIKQLSTDLVHQHQYYLKEKQLCNCPRQETENGSFLLFLQRSGVYQTYLMSITKSAAVIVNERFPYAGELNRNSKEYQTMIAEVYTFLIKEMNCVLNELTSSGVENTVTSPLMNLEPLLVYAKEATAIGALLLADRYYLERISRNEHKENYWFDYAVFQMEIDNMEKALECTKKSLNVNKNHNYSLLLCGIIFMEKGKHAEAETCFLSMLFQKRNWMEGWATVHLFYCHIGNEEGADMCLEMAKRLLNSPKCKMDYFMEVDDLSWTASICPNVIFLRTAILLLKIRAFTLAEKALSRELIKYTGICNYYLAVIMYYHQNYVHALIHLQEAERLHGLDCAIATLSGHCFLALRELEKAQEEYTYVLELYNRPDDMHLLYMYLAVVKDRLGDKQAARKLLLLACKLSPTPYTWLTTGILYYDQKDYISAEQCLMQANLCDNRLPEIWGYLTLVNLELNHLSEAEVCYKQARKNKMRDEELKSRIEEAMRSLNKNEVCQN